MEHVSEVLGFREAFRRLQEAARRFQENPRRCQDAPRKLEEVPWRFPGGSLVFVILDINVLMVEEESMTLPIPNCRITPELSLSAESHPTQAVATVTLTWPGHTRLTVAEMSSGDYFTSTCHI